MLRGLTAFAERSPTTPRRNWLSRLGRGLRPLAANLETWRSLKKLSPFSHLFVLRGYGVLGASARDEAVVSVFNEGEVAD